MIDLQKLSDMVDKAIENETPESLNKWFREQRECNLKIKNMQYYFVDYHFKHVRKLNDQFSTIIAQFSKKELVRLHGKIPKDKILNYVEETIELKYFSSLKGKINDWISLTDTLKITINHISKL